MSRGRPRVYSDEERRERQRESNRRALARERENGWTQPTGHRAVNDIIDQATPSDDRRYGWDATLDGAIAAAAVAAWHEQLWHWSRDDSLRQVCDGCSVETSRWAWAGRYLYCLPCIGRWAASDSPEACAWRKRREEHRRRWRGPLVWPANRRAREKKAAALSIRVDAPLD